jgi:hypothetical protein
MEKLSVFEIGWFGSIALTSSIIRIIQLPTFWILKPINIKIDFIDRWKYRLFINDLLIDVKRHRKNNHEMKRLLSFYDSSRMISWFYQV